MCGTEKIFVNSNDIKLEAELFLSNSENFSMVTLICHPHPQYGGNMCNNVVSAIFNTFIQNSVSCLRFNFRGVGNSTGKHTNGKGELSDTKACIDFLVNEYNFEKIIIYGYSYGAAIGCSTVNYSKNIIAYCAISFPWDYMGQEYKNLSQSKKYKFFIQGNRDTLAMYENFKNHYEMYLEPKRYKIINGADHFYVGFEHEVAKEAYEFYQLLVE
jgi:alpha/beta superfamily hydrolase